jgi:hypothetical protein
MNFTKYRFNNRQETLREKRNMHLITSCIYTQSTAMQNRVCKWPTTIVCIHFCQNYLAELPIKLNPLLPLIRILDNSKFCNGPVNFEITRFNCIINYKYLLLENVTLTYMLLHYTACGIRTHTCTSCFRGDRDTKSEANANVHLLS